MKKLFLIISILPILVEAQSLRYSAFIAPNFSIYTSEVLFQQTKPAFKYWGFGASSSFIAEYYFPNFFSVGTSIEYLLTRAELYTPCYCVHTADKTVNIRNMIATQSMDVPVFIKLRTNKNVNHFTYLQSEFGISWLFYAHRNVEIESSFPGGSKSKYIREQISNESFSLQNNNDNKLGTFFRFGIGQNFQLKQINFFTELSYRQDINSWLYNAVETPYGVKEFSIKRQSILLKIGITFNNKKKES